MRSDLLIATMIGLTVAARPEVGAYVIASTLLGLAEAPIWLGRFALARKAYRLTDKLFDLAEWLTTTAHSIGDGR